MIMLYKPKSLINGYKLGLEREGQYVAVPQKMVLQHPLSIVYNGETMDIDKNTPILKEISFQDKFGRGKYKLLYYLWQPVDNLFGIK